MISSNHDHAQLDLTNDVERSPLQDFTKRNYLARRFCKTTRPSSSPTDVIEVTVASERGKARLQVTSLKSSHHREERDTSLNISYRKPERKFINFRLITLLCV